MVSEYEENLRRGSSDKAKNILPLSPDMGIRRQIETLQRLSLKSQYSLLLSTLLKSA